MAEVTYRGINIVFDGSLDEGYKTKALSEAIKNIDLIYNNPKTRFILNEMEIRKVELFIHDNNYTKYIPPEEWTTGNPVILFDPFSTTISKGIYDLPMIFSVGSILFHEMYHAFDPALWIEKYKLEPTDPKYTDLSEEIAIFMTNLLYRSHYDEPLRTTHEGTFLKLITPPILQRLNSFFQNLIPSLFQAEQNYSPIIIDLNGDGVQTTTLDDGVYFDHPESVTSPE